MKSLVMLLSSSAALLVFQNTMGPDTFLPIASAGVIAVQVLLLWRVRHLEKEDLYHRRVQHWEANVLQLIAWKLDLDIPPRPERRE